MKSSITSKKCHAKIRMYSNAGPNVNKNRAELSSSLGIRKSMKLDSSPIFTQKKFESEKMEITGGQLKSKGASKKEIYNSWSDIKLNVFIEYNPLVVDKIRKEKWELNRKGNIVIANISLLDLDILLENDKEVNNIFNVELGQTLKIPKPKKRKPTKNNLKVSPPFLADDQSGSSNVLIGIIDVEGFDFSHPDFLDKNGNTRFISIWDQGGTHRESPRGGNFGYGSELTNELMNSAIESSNEYKVPAYELEPQSTMIPGSHGTHVASIAGGNSGVCPNSLLAGVLIHLTDRDFDRRKSFYDSTRLANAVDYLLSLGDEMGLPVSINISLGTNGHAHDGSAPVCRWIDSELKIPGRSVCVAAGNAGQENPEYVEDLGHFMGRIHTSGRIPANGLEKDIEWIVKGDGIVDISENELEIWYSSQDRFAISLKPPGQEWIGPIEPGEYIENFQLNDLSFVSIYNELYHTSNGSNYIAIYLTPDLEDRNNIKGVPHGMWKVRLYGRQIRDGSFHGWIERDDVFQYEETNFFGGTKWFFPSYFTDTSNVNDYSIGSLACANEVVGVANLNPINNAINSSSSPGPTRDERFKPEVAAPGTNVQAANGFDYDDLWIEMTGTSMASPFVCGVIGLMFKEERNLTASQIIGILKCTARPLPGMSYDWDNDSGYGVVDVEACIEHAKKINKNTDITKRW
ncbi:S8 family serine peptidase [Ulvibacterium sp.]|uniref:S8 family serine peptidase n=1 Tax=Ulvibacterium sp. TaxID=2665914 RepID=UPI0026176E54|nr:S8 family serine peptidase [Ulvibacterium sp.]